MKLHLYILALIFALATRLPASETNATITAADSCESTNKCQQAAPAAKPGTTKIAPENLPWSYSATTGDDDKFKDISSSLAKRSGNGPSLWRSAGATVFVLGLLFAVNYWLRKRGSRFTGPGRSARLRIVERVAVDHRRGILLIEADGERIVATACADRIELLAVLPSKPHSEEAVPS